MDDSIIGALAIVCIFGLPIVGWIATRAFRFIERMEMIKRGMVPPPDINISRRAYRAWVRNGGVGPMPGMGQPSAPQQPYVAPPQQPFAGSASKSSSWSSCGPDDDVQTALYKGIRLAAIGFALLIGLSFVGGTFGSPDFHGGPWLLGGLVPMFVGVAQIIIALISGAQLPGQAQRANFGPPPPPPPSPGPPPGAWEQPRAVRFEELSKPVQPPDLR